MKAALLLLGTLAGQPTIPVSERVPHLKVEATCKAAAATDAAMRLSEAQPFERCISDEAAAQQQLAAVWSANAGPARDRCEAEATIDDNQSYVDLLTCMQMAGLAGGISPAASLRGASKKRNMN
jgi:hypothetical protein